MWTKEIDKSGEEDGRVQPHKRGACPIARPLRMWAGPCGVATHIGSTLAFENLMRTPPISRCDVHGTGLGKQGPAPFVRAPQTEQHGRRHRKTNQEVLDDYRTRSIRAKRIHWRTSWASYRERNQKSKTAVRWGRRVRTVLPSASFDKLNGSSPSWSSNFHHVAAPWAPLGSLTGGHVKVMLVYSHSLSLDYQGFRSFSPHHKEAAGPVRPAVARVEAHCDLQRVPSCALATAWHSGHVACR